MSAETRLATPLEAYAYIVAECIFNDIDVRLDPRELHRMIEEIWQLRDAIANLATTSSNTLDGNELRETWADTIRMSGRDGAVGHIVAECSDRSMGWNWDTFLVD